MNPQIVEAALREAPGVRDSVVFGLNQDEFEEVHAVLLMRDGTTSLTAVRLANENLLPFQRISGWTSWPHADFPRLVLGKRWIADSCRILPRHAAMSLTVGKRSMGRSRSRTSNRELIRSAESKSWSLYCGRPRDTDAANDRVVHDFGLESLDLLQLLLTSGDRDTVLALPTGGAGGDRYIVDLQSALIRTPGKVGQAKPAARMWHRWTGWNPLRRLARALIIDPYIVFASARKRSQWDLLSGLEPPVDSGDPTGTPPPFYGLSRNLSGTFPACISKKLFSALRCLDLTEVSRFGEVRASIPRFSPTYFSPTLRCPDSARPEKAFFRPANGSSEAIVRFSLGARSRAPCGANANAQSCQLPQRQFFRCHAAGQARNKMSFGPPVEYPRERSSHFCFTMLSKAGSKNCKRTAGTESLVKDFILAGLSALFVMHGDLCGDGGSRLSGTTSSEYPQRDTAQVSRSLLQPTASGRSI